MFSGSSALLPAGAEAGLRHLLLWDGACGLCQRAVAWIARHDREGRFEAVPYQEAPSPPMTPQLRAACARSVHVIARDGRTLKGGRASLFILGEVGWPRTARVLGVPPLVWLVELGYHIVAGNRHLFSRWLFRS